MWVRSQSKIVLEEVKSMAIRASLEDGMEGREIEGWSIITMRPSTYSELGIYKTRERAVEVMNELQIHLESVEKAKLGVIRCNINDSFVYEMPID